MTIIADSNEALQHRDLLDTLSSMGIEIQVEPIGMDFLIVGSGMFAIEYKKVPDLLGRMASGGLDQQMRRIAEYDFPILLLEGIMAPTKNGTLKNLKFSSRWHYSSVVGILFSLQMRGIAVVQTSSPMATAEALKTIHHQATTQPKPGKQFKFAKVASFSRPAGEQIKLLCALPGINIVLAKRILAEYGTPLGFMTAPSSDIVSKIDMLGPVKLNTIKRCLEVKVNDYSDKPATKTGAVQGRRPGASGQGRQGRRP